MRKRERTTPLTVIVKSCSRDRNLGFHDVIRETWGASLAALGVNVRFAFADPTTVVRESDEINFPECPDTYLGLPTKTWYISLYANRKGFQHVFLCDNDTLINPEKLVSCGWESYDYAGYFCRGQEEVGKTFYYKDHMGQYPNCNTWTSGGLGYFLSNKALRFVAAEPPTIWAEDMYVGQVIGPKIRSGEIKAAHIPLDKRITWHFRKRNAFPVFTPGLLREIYKAGGPDEYYRPL